MGDLGLKDALEEGDLEMNAHFAFVAKGTMRDYLKIKLALMKLRPELSENFNLFHKRISASKLTITKDGVEK